MAGIELMVVILLLVVLGMAASQAGVDSRDRPVDPGALGADRSLLTHVLPFAGPSGEFQSARGAQAAG